MKREHKRFEPNTGRITNDGKGSVHDGDRLRTAGALKTVRKEGNSSIKQRGTDRKSKGLQSSSVPKKAVKKPVSTRRDQQ